MVGLLGGLLLSACAPEFAPPPLDAPVASYAADLGGTVAAAAAVTGDLGELRARCLDSLGYPQALRALAYADDPTPADDPLGIAPGDFGPSTPAEAERFGMIGSELSGADARAGAIVSRDPGFDGAAERCDHWIYDSAVPGLRALQSQAAAFVDDVRAELVGLVSDAVEPSLRARVVCTRRAGYPGLTVGRFLAASSMREILGFAGVEAGHVEPGGPDVLRRDAVGEGEVAVFPPVPGPRYLPSGAEVRFARAYAECGRATGFARVTGSAVVRARSLLEVERREESDGLRGRLVAALTRMRSPEG